MSGTDLPSRKAGSVSALGLTMSALYTPAFIAQIREKTKIKVHTRTYTIYAYKEVRT